MRAADPEQRTGQQDSDRCRGPEPGSSGVLRRAWRCGARRRRGRFGRGRLGNGITALSAEVEFDGDGTGSTADRAICFYGAPEIRMSRFRVIVIHSQRNQRAGRNDDASTRAICQIRKVLMVEPKIFRKQNLRAWRGTSADRLHAGQLTRPRTSSATPSARRLESVKEGPYAGVTMRAHSWIFTAPASRTPNKTLLISRLQEPAVEASTASSRVAP